MENLNQKLKSFFESNKKILENNFPGLNLRTLKDSCLDYVGESLDESQIVSVDKSNAIDFFLSRVLEGVPLSYISQKAHFYGLDFFVNESVLIPRFETELLVEECLNNISTSTKNSLKLLEVGVGSGCVGLTILSEVKDKTIEFVGTDISSTAIDVANKNRQKLEFKISKNAKIKFLLSDRLDEVLDKRFDFIVSNPPYIKSKQDKILVHNQVLKYEPEVALFLDDEIYDSWFEQLFDQVKTCLSDDGLFLMEGHENHLERLKELAAKKNFKNIFIKNDLTGRLRFLLMRK